MKSGDLKHYVTLQQPTAGAADTYGETTDAWAAVAKVWAHVAPLQGREAVYAAQINPQTTHKITIRYRSDIAATWRILHDGRYFHLTAPPRNVGEGREWLELDCVERP